MNQKPVSLYLHVPFCLRRCPYCNFYSTTDLARRGNYTQALVRAVASAPLAPGTPVPTVYFGGGTPSLLGEELLTVLGAVRERFALAPDAEITLEANPGALGGALLEKLRRGGFNRLSLGLQAGEDQGLRTLGRIHTRRESGEAVALARLAGFQNLSVDIMLGTPGQTLSQAEALADYAVGLGPEHISAYLLKIEPGTAFDRENVAAACPDPDAMAELYLAVCRRLEEAGFAHYEISNFARPGFASRHNKVYWQLGEYLGIGPSAYSFLEGRRFHLPADLSGFLERQDPWELREEDGPGGDLEDLILLSLRLDTGLDTARVRELGGDPEELLARAAPLERAGLLTIREGVVALTDRGFLLSNSIITRLL